MFLIAPYRWVADPLWGWWLGTFLLGFWASALGELTLAVMFRLNRKKIAELAEEMIRYHEASLTAMASGEKTQYSKINKLANESYGKSFFLQIAMGSASLWPAVFALAWLQTRFQNVPVPVPLLPDNYVAGFIVCYILARLMFSRLKYHLPFLRETLALARRMAPEKRRGLLAGLLKKE